MEKKEQRSMPGIGQQAVLDSAAPLFPLMKNSAGGLANPGAPTAPPRDAPAAYRYGNSHGAPKPCIR
jgi:hypothetical protein